MPSFSVDLEGVRAAYVATVEWFHGWGWFVVDLYDVVARTLSVFNVQGTKTPRFAVLCLEHISCCCVRVCQICSRFGPDGTVTASNRW
jgi:hypothetical protein